MEISTKPGTHQEEGKKSDFFSFDKIIFLGNISKKIVFERIILHEDL